MIYFMFVFSFMLSEWTMTLQQFMQHTTEREPIGAGIVGYTFRKHFRCHISVRSSEKKYFSSFIHENIKIKKRLKDNRRFEQWYIYIYKEMIFTINPNYLHACVRFLFGEIASQSQIRYSDVAMLVQKDIGRLQVSVNDVSTVHVFQSQYYFCRVELHLSLVEHSVLA